MKTLSSGNLVPLSGADHEELARIRGEILSELMKTGCPRCRAKLRKLIREANDGLPDEADFSSRKNAESA